MIYFTSDTHFGDERLNLYGRDLMFKNKEEIDNYIIERWNNRVTNLDIVYHLGDVAMNPESYENIKKLNGYKILIKGNYDMKYDDSFLYKYFNQVYEDYLLKDEAGNVLYFLNHFPEKTSFMYKNIVGHIHRCWLVQRRMVNVGCDIHHFSPVSLDEVDFLFNGIEKYYDKNVFAGELQQNLMK